MNKRQKAMMIYDHIEEIIIVFLFAVMVGAIFLQVVSRYAFNSSISWSEALGRYMFVWISWLGVSIGAREGEHIKITMLTDKLPERVAQILNIICDIIVIIIAGLTIYYSFPMMSILMENHVMETTLHIGQIWGFMAVPVGSGLMIFRTIISIIKSIGVLHNGGGMVAEGGEG